MENVTKVKFELEIAAQRLISEYMVNNAYIESELNQGIKAAFEKIDIAATIEKAVTDCIITAIKQSSDYGAIRNAVKEKTDKIVEHYIDSAVNKFKTDYN
jgi:fructose/tagatose bisphosphate aldolase